MTAAADDLMVSRAALDDFRGEAAALALLIDLFVAHGRCTFRPQIEDLAGVAWRGRGARQRFARAVAVLHVKRHLRWLPGGRYRIVSREVLTVAEYRAQHPGAGWRNGLSWPAGKLA